MINRSTWRTATYEREMKLQEYHGDEDEGEGGGRIVLRGPSLETGETKAQGRLMPIVTPDSPKFSGFHGCCIQASMIECVYFPRSHSEFCTC